VDEVLAALDQASVPAGRIYTVADIAADPHYQARGMLDSLLMNDGSTLMVPGIVPKLSATPGSQRRNAPALGQDSDAVLRELELTPEQIQGLKDKGIVSGAATAPHAHMCSLALQAAEPSESVPLRAVPPCAGTLGAAALSLGKGRTTFDAVRQDAS
jgi:hypothetical protein